MNQLPPTSARPFFLPVRSGERFCIVHPPHPETPPRGGVLYIHPFAEELNKSRRMVARQCRALAGAGYGVLQMDLFGCGDSSGTLRDASWETWKDDVASAWAWLADYVKGPIVLWGLRLGALLALDCAHAGVVTPQRMVLWQPVLSGDAHLTQFLRIELGQQIQAGATVQDTPGRSARQRLADGESVDIGGYHLSPELTAGIGAIDVANLMVGGIRVDWFEVAPLARDTLAPASMKIVQEWQRRHDDLHTHLVQGPAFWASQEITECAALLSETTMLLGTEASHES